MEKELIIWGKMKLVLIKGIVRESLGNNISTFLFGVKKKGENWVKIEVILSYRREKLRDFNSVCVFVCFWVFVYICVG